MPLSEVIRNATPTLNHTYLRLNIRLDTVLRLFLVTPDVHRIQNPMSKDEQNCNFVLFFMVGQNIWNLQVKTRDQKSIHAY